MPLDEIIGKAADAIDKAKPVVEGAISAGADKAGELAEKADNWASGEHPHVDKAYNALSNALGNVTDGAVNAVADGANVAYEFVKNKAEEVSRKDIDGDGKIGKNKAAPESADASAKTSDEEHGRKPESASKAVAERISNTDIDGDGKIG